MRVIIKVTHLGGDNAARAVGYPCRASSTASAMDAAARCAAKVRHFPRKNISHDETYAIDIEICAVATGLRSSIYLATWPDP